MQMEEWDAFDVNRVTQLTQGRPLEAVALEVLHRFNLLEKLRLPKQKLRSFLRVSLVATSWAWACGNAGRQRWSPRLDGTLSLRHSWLTHWQWSRHKLPADLCRRLKHHTGGATHTTTAHMLRMWCRALPVCLRRMASWRS